MVLFLSIPLTDWAALPPPSSPWNSWFESQNHVTKLNRYMKSQPIKTFKVRFSTTTNSCDIDKWFIDKSKVTLPHTLKESPPADFKIQWPSGFDLIGIRKLRTNCKATIDNQDPVSKVLELIYPSQASQLYSSKCRIWAHFPILRTGPFNCYCVDWACLQTVLRCPIWPQLKHTELAVEHHWMNAISYLRIDDMRWVDRPFAVVRPVDQTPDCTADQTSACRTSVRDLGIFGSLIYSFGNAVLGKSLWRPPPPPRRNTFPLLGHSRVQCPWWWHT